MNILRLVLTGMALLVVSGCADGASVLGPTAPASSVESRSSDLPALSARRVETSGSFDAIVDFTTLTLTPRGRNCLLVVRGQLVFSGTLEGPAVGQTTALVFAPCADVATNTPGTFEDVFRSELVFDGTVDGEAASANVLYMGRSQPGGRITGRLVFSNGVQGRLEVDAQLAVGGEYQGSVVVN